MGDYPRLQVAERLTLGRLQIQEDAELRLAAGPAGEQDQVAGNP
jgi:hypothetical protein